MGAGAIGGVTAARMTRAGWAVQIVSNRPEAVQLAQDPGFHLFGVGGEAHIPVQVVKTFEELQGPLDVVFVATKAAEASAVAAGLLPLLNPDAALVSLQNGICEEALAEVVGAERIVGCVVGWGATFHGPGRMEVTSEGEFVVGRLDGRVDARLEAVRDMLDYHCFLADCGWLGDLRRHLTIRLIGFKYRRIRSSSLQSLERGRKTEVDFLNGYICRQGHRHHVPTPVNDAVVEMIHEIEDGKRPISMANLAAL